MKFCVALFLGMLMMVVCATAAKTYLVETVDNPRAYDDHVPVSYKLYTFWDLWNCKSGISCL